MGLYPGEICYFCNESIELSWICQRCHKVFCEECIDAGMKEAPICYSCDGQNFRKNRSGDLICKDCHSREYQMIKTPVQTCKNCGSTDILRIDDLQTELMGRYKKIVNSARKFVPPVKNQVQALNQIRQNLLEVRRNTPICLHFPTLEEELLYSIHIFENSFGDLDDQVNHFFQEIYRNLHFIGEIPDTHPGNLAYISEILNFFEREQNKVETLANSCFKAVEAKLPPIEEKIAFMESMQAQFTPYLSKMGMDSDEQIVFTIRCRLDNVEGNPKVNNRKNGTILLSSKRLYFFYEQGLWKKQIIQLFSVLLKDLRTTEIKGKLKKKVSLNFLKSMYEFRLSKADRDILVNWIKQAQKFEVTARHEDINRKRIEKKNLSAALFQEELEGAIYELIGYHNLGGALFGNSVYRDKIGDKYTIPSEYDKKYRDSPYHPGVPIQKIPLNKKHDPGLNRSNSGYSFQDSIKPQPSPYYPQPTFPTMQGNNQWMSNNINSENKPPWIDTQTLMQSNVQREISGLQNEEQILRAQLNILENQFDGGQSLDPEFFKSYKLSQTKLFSTMARLEQIKSTRIEK